MPPHLRVLAGPSPDCLVPITNVVNTSSTYKFSSDLFEGEIAVHIKDFTDEWGQLRHSDYFKRDDRQGVTWSIQVSGTFLTPHSTDDIMFGNIFDRRLKLPRASAAALKFMQFIDPTLEHDLLSQTKPWALSPLVATMPHFSHQYVPGYVRDEDADSDVTVSSTSSSSSSVPGMLRDFTVNALDFASSPWAGRKLSGGKNQHQQQGLPSCDVWKNLHFDNASQRRKYFKCAERRKQVELGPRDIISADFCYGFLEFHPSLSLRLPGGLSFDLMRYWDKHPVRFVCCERKKASVAATGDTRSGEEEEEDPWGRVFWCVMIEIADVGTR